MVDEDGGEEADEVEGEELEDGEEAATGFFEHNGDGAEAWEGEEGEGHDAEGLRNIIVGTDSLFLEGFLVGLLLLRCHPLLSDGRGFGLEEDAELGHQQLLGGEGPYHGRIGLPIHAGVARDRLENAPDTSRVAGRVRLPKRMNVAAFLR